MKKYLHNARLLLPVLIISLFFCTAALGQKTWTRAAGNNDWSSANNWSPVGVPTASDAVIIPDNALFTIVNVNINASCASLTISGGIHPLTVFVKTGITFNVTNTGGGTGLISIGAPADGSSDKIIFVGEFLGLHTSPVLNCVALTMADVIFPFSDDNSLQIESGIVAISGNLTLNGSENRVFVNRGKLTIGGTFNNGGSLITINGSGSTVEYNGANQVMRSGTYSNLIVSGSGTKSAAVTVNEKLSVQGTATVSNTITYGSYAILEYKGSSAQITSNIEFPINMPATVIIDNPAGVGLNSNKTIAKELVLTSGILIAGNKLSMGASGTPIIRRSGGTMTGTLQTPANDYNVVYTGNSKTTGPELSSGGLKNITVNLSAATETLTLNQNRTPDGDLDISSGTFNLSTFTINRSAAGGILKVRDNGILKIGGVNSLPINYTYDLEELSVIEYAGTNQTVTARNYTNLVVSGSGTKTASTAADTYIAGELTVQPGAVFSIGGATFIADANTVLNGTLNSTSTTGFKVFRRININSGGLFNSVVNEDYTIQGDLAVNGTGSIISGSGNWYFSSLNGQFLTGTATITNAFIYNHCYYYGGNFTFKNLNLVDAQTSHLDNHGTISITNRMWGSGRFDQNVGSILNYSGGQPIELPIANFKATATGNTVNYSMNGQQNLYIGYEYDNLTLSGSGQKLFFAGNKVNGVLSIQGTATTLNAALADALTFGPDATLEYAGNAPQTSTDVEFKSTGGPKNLIINNPSGVTLHASRTIDGSVTISNGILNIPASNILTIANGNAIAGTGFGSTKHINTQVSGANQGFLRVDKIAKFAPPYLFPVGNGTHYLPAKLTVSDLTASNNTFSVAAFQGITANGLPNGAAIADKSNLVDAVWTINNNVGNTTLPVDVTLGWSGLEGTNFAALADNLIGIAHYDNPAWGDFTGSGNQLNNTATRLGVTTFSPFAVGQSGAFNSAVFAAPSAMGILANGTIRKDVKSAAKSTPGNKEMQLMSILANPVSNNLQLHFTVSKNDKVALIISSADGKTVYSNAIQLQSGKSIITVDASTFLKGTYFVMALFKDGQITSIKFIK